MSVEILLFSSFEETQFLEKILSNFSIRTIKLNEYSKNSYKNKNLLFFLNDLSLIDSLKDASSTNSVLCVLSDNSFNENLNHPKILKSPVSISKLQEYAINIFKKNILEFGDIKIEEKKIINKNNNKFTYFTDLENEIFAEIINNKKLNKTYLKENVLNIKETINTYSIESHFSRIRKKLLSIESSINIRSRGDNFFIN